MVTIVLTFGLLNLVLGFATAVFLARPPGAAQREVAVPSEPPAAPAGAATAGAAEVCPAQWQAHLRERGLEPATFVESLLWRVRDELAELRERWVATDTSVRSGLAEAAFVPELVADCDRWLEQVNLWANASAAAKDESPYPKLHAYLEELLLDHSFEVQSAGEALRDIPSRQGRRPGGQATAHELARLLDAVNAMRDATDGLLALILREEGRLSTLPAALQTGADAQIYSRLGLEVLFDRWWSGDPDRVRLVSGVLLDLDRVAKLNGCLGSAAGDQVLSAFGALLKTLVRKERGFDRVARLSGQTFFLFLGDTAARNAVNGAERIRHTIEATSFRVAGSTVEITASCGAAELGRSESLSAFLERLDAVTREAKKAGRNRTCVDEGGGPQLVGLPQYHVKGRVIDVEPAAAV